MRIKGHTEIQLTDVRTGKVKTFHDDNMMTNGLAEFMKNHGMLCGTPFTDAVKNDLINTLLGGILLFDTALTESSSNTRLTDGVKMTANACHGLTHTGDPTELGSYDSNESGWQNEAHTVYRHVFTWTTSQGNGRIASACLTSKPHGFVGEGNSTSRTRITDGNLGMYTYSSQKGLNNSEKVMMILDNEIYFLNTDTTDDTLTISKAHVTDTECDLRDVVNLQSVQTEEVLTIQNTTSTPFPDLFSKISCRVLTNTIVMSFSDQRHPRFLIFTFPKTLASVTSILEVTPQATSLTFGNNISFLSADATKLIVSSNADKSYTVDLSNLANVTEIPQDVNPGHNLIYSSGKRHILYNSIYDETLNRIIPINADGGNYDYINQDVYKDSIELYGKNESANGVKVDVGRRNDYLATINNLSSPVTKDSTQTMKVIYTLTFTA